MRFEGSTCASHRHAMNLPAWRGRNGQRVRLVSGPCEPGARNLLRAGCAHPASEKSTAPDGAGRKKATLELQQEELKLTSEAELAKQRSDVLDDISRESLRKQLISGIQATSSSHDLPPAEVAVRNLVEYAKHAHMSTLTSQAYHRRAGYPFGSIVEFAVDGQGYPVLPLSSLSMTMRNLAANPRCALQVQAPGWSGLSNARVTLFGDVFPVDPRSLPQVQELFREKSQRLGSGFHSAYSVNSKYYVMSNVVDILFIGGYGTVQWIKPKDYSAARPDAILERSTEILATLNGTFATEMKALLPEVDDVYFIAVDQRGVELRTRRGTEDVVQRIRFQKDCFNESDVCAQIRSLVSLTDSSQ